MPSISLDDIEPISGSTEVKNIEKSLNIIQAENVSNYNQIENVLSQGLNLNNEKEVHEPTCPICSSPLRVEAEALWDSNPVEKPIREMFSLRANIKIGKEVVSNHMRYHKDRATKEIQKLEYINRIQRLKNQPTSSLAKIDMMETILLERILGVNSIVPNNEVNSVEIEKIKSAETTKLMGAMGQLIKIRVSLTDELRSNGNIISFNNDEFIEVFSNAINSAKTQIEKKCLTEILESLKGIQH